MIRKNECDHKWAGHGERSFYCSECGYFVQTVEELDAVLRHERDVMAAKMEDLLDAEACPDCRQKLKERLEGLKK